jgi:predicted ATPase
VAANRLVTLVGAGGIGKTRLGIGLARRLLPNFADGVWLAELESLSDPKLVPTAIATALGLSDAGDSAKRLATTLASKHLLLVLDNCEHVVGAAASIVEALLRASASLHVIATSREPLRAEGEWVYKVLPLNVPPNGSDGFEEVLQYSAAKLLIARICAAEPRIRFDLRTAATTAKICRHLDGIPLAIELAAASAAAVGMDALACRLDERFSLLSDGRRTAPARHQTLRATLDWSYALLPESERVVMRRLSIFGGTFTMEAASKVAASGEIAASVVMHCLANLVAKSLVASDVGGPVPYYRLLETTRAYAMEKLTESGEFETVARRLVAFGTDCLSRFWQAHPHS